MTWHHGEGPSEERVAGRQSCCGGEGLACWSNGEGGNKRCGNQSRHIGGNRRDHGRRQFMVTSKAAEVAFYGGRGGGYCRKVG
jgi:hypothetical protein